MRIRRLITIIAIVATHTLAFCQETEDPGGGSGGGGTPGGGGTSIWGGIPISLGDSNWHAEAFLKGTDTWVNWVTVTYGNDREQVIEYDWETRRLKIDGVLMPVSLQVAEGARNGTLNQHRVTYLSEGKITVKVKWMGTPESMPNHLDLKFNSNVSYEYKRPGSGNLNDGMGCSEAVVEEDYNTFGTISKKYLRRFSLDDEGTVMFTYEPSAFAQSNGYNSYCLAKARWLGITKDTRGVELKCTSHPGVYVKALTGVQKQFEQREWSGKKSLPYSEAVKGQVKPEFTATGQLYNTWAAMTISQVEKTNHELRWGSDFWDRFYWQGEVFGLAEGRYTYTYPNASGDTVTISDRCDGWIWNGWGIESIWYEKDAPFTVFTYRWGEPYVLVDDHDHIRSVGTSDAITFKYKWDIDGAEADATVKLNYVLPLERNESIGSYEEEVEPENPISDPNNPSPPRQQPDFIPIEFIGITDWVDSLDNVAQANLDPVYKIWTGDNKKQYQKIKAVAGVGALIPHFKAACTAVGLISELNIAFGDSPPPVDISRLANGSHYFRKAWHLNKIYPRPAICPSEATAEASLLQYMWKVSWRPLYIVYVYAGDVYNANGFDRQVIDFETKYNKYDLRFEYKEPAYQVPGL